MKRLVCLMVAAAMLLGLAACVPTTQPNEPAATAAPGANETAQPGDSTETPAAEEVSDDYLIFNIGMEPKTWDPQLNNSGAGGQVIINLYDGLVRDTKEGIKMATAESYEVSANAEGVADTVYTFKLRDDAKWSDGQSVTANDFEYAWKRACSPEMASPYAFLITDYIKGAYEYFSGTGSRDDVGVKALDEHTLQVELIQPTAYFLNLVSFFTYMPCREDMASTGEGWEKDPAKCITNGAFYLEEYKIGSHVLLKKNENFWNKDNVKLAGIKALFITDATTSLQGYEAGEINITSTLPGEEIPRLLAEDPNFSSEPALGTTYIEFNMDAEIVNDVNVRKALSLAIDRKLICDQVLRNGAVPAAAFVAPPFKLSTGESLRAMDEFGNVMTEYEINPNGAEVEKAREYLAAAGYPNGEGFPTLELLYYESGSNSQIAEAVQQMWKENLGITVNLKVEEYAVFANTRSSGNYTLDITGWSADYNDPMTMLSLFTANGVNNARWRYKEYAGVPEDTTLNPENKAYDDAVIMASKTMGTERDGYLKEAEKVLMDNMVICPIHYHTYTQVIDYGKVAGPGRTPIGQWDFQYYTVLGK
ncbi:MAG: peptide ABC transporter substrate-binding protein [Eubacteriales bacterium]|nr:peptide ABC transporter substrate-binding protein [Christensenellaceae bacterium]MDY5719627.1 peptide ABC transporter substrate-binding protein [Eubacteriales bacterium]